MESLGRIVDAEESHSNLKTSVERAKSKLLTLDALTRCGRCGSLETESDGRGMLLPSTRARGSTDGKLKIMDEVQRVDQQRSSDLTRRDYYQIGQSRRSHKPSHQQVSKIGHIYSNTTQSF